MVCSPLFHSFERPEANSFTPQRFGIPSSQCSASSAWVSIASFALTLPLRRAAETLRPYSSPFARVSAGSSLLPHSQLSQRISLPLGRLQVIAVPSHKSLYLNNRSRRFKLARRAWRNVDGTFARLVQRLDRAGRIVEGLRSLCGA